VRWTAGWAGLYGAVDGDDGDDGDVDLGLLTVGIGTWISVAALSAACSLTAGGGVDPQCARTTKTHHPRGDNALTPA
jgi:hypothetical protein